MPASAADARAGASSNPSVWYASFGSNILSERFACYLEGGRVEGMVRDMPGSRDPSPHGVAPVGRRPHRLFFAHVLTRRGTAAASRSSTSARTVAGVPGVPGVKPEVEPKPKPPSRTSHNERNVAERPRWALRTASTA